MKFYNFLIKYRFVLSLICLALAILVNVTSGFWPAFILYFIALIGLVSHFLIGPLRLVQTPMENGDIVTVQKIIDSVWFPGLLIKPIRSTYYTLKGNVAMLNKDYDAAELNLKKSSEVGSTMVPEAAGSNKMQLAMMSMQKGDLKGAEGNLRAALKLGISDNESKAVAYLGMCQIMMNKRQFKAAKDYFKKTKALKPTTPEVIAQIKEIEKYISRMPG